MDCRPRTFARATRAWCTRRLFLHESVGPGLIGVGFDESAGAPSGCCAGGTLEAPSCPR